MELPEVQLYEIDTKKLTIIIGNKKFRPHEKLAIIYSKDGLIITNNEGCHQVFRDPNFNNPDSKSLICITLSEIDAKGDFGIMFSDFDIYITFNQLWRMDVIGTGCKELNIKEWYHYFGCEGHRVHSNYCKLISSCDDISAGRLPEFKK